MKKERDLSNRPDHYNTMNADICIVHDCDLEKLKEMIDNNSCERAVRPFTNLRKSFGGFSSEKGGEVAAAWLTFIETCKLQKKAALDFFNEFFRKITEGRSDYELIAQEALG